MGQKTNPNILQLSKTNDWNSKYIEKASKDFYLYTHKNLETKKFIYAFFKQNNMIVQNCRINFSNNNMSVFLSYQHSYDSMPNIVAINKTQKIFVKKKFQINFKHKLKKQFEVLKSIKNYYNYKSLSYIQNTLKKRLALKKIFKIKRLKAINYYKNYLNLKTNKNIKNSLSKSFLKTFFNSLSEFHKNLNNITLVLKPLNTNINHSLKAKELLKIKEGAVKLKKYQRNEFFKEGIGVALSAVSNNNSSEMLSNYISTNLKKLKKHNFFLKFLKALLTVFVNRISVIKGIKIKIKGRLNGRPRARSKIIHIGKVMPLFTIKASINYSETTAYTSNGTLGVKVWVCEKIKKNVNRTKKIKIQENKKRKTR